MRKGVVPSALVAAVLLAWALPLPSWGSEDAQDVDALLQISDGNNEVVPMLFDDIEPGMAPVIRRYVLTTNLQDAGSLSVRVVNLLDYEHGCNRPERAANDRSCDGDDGTVGELSGELLVGVHVSDAVETCARARSEGQEMLPPTAVDVASQAPIDLGPVDGAADDRFCVELSFTLPEAVGNIVQSDSISFDVEFALEQLPSVTGVGSAGADVASQAAVVHARPEGSPAAQSPSRLAITGAEVLVWLYVGFAGLALGIGLLLGARRGPFGRSARHAP